MPYQSIDISIIFLSGINLDNSLPISVNLYIAKPIAFSCCEVNYLTIIQECKFFSAIKNDRELIRVGEKTNVATRS